MNNIRISSLEKYDSFKKVSNFSDWRMNIPVGPEMKSMESSPMCARIFFLPNILLLCGL